MSIFADTVYDFYLNFRLGHSKKDTAHDFFYIDVENQRKIRNTSLKESTECSIRSYNHNDLPPKRPNCVRLYCISDTHERHTVFNDVLESLDCDILIHAG